MTPMQLKLAGAREVSVEKQRFMVQTREDRSTYIQPFVGLLRPRRRNSLLLLWIHRARPSFKRRSTAERIAMLTRLPLSSPVARIFGPWNQATGLWECDRPRRR